MWYYLTFKPGARVIYELPQPHSEEQKLSQTRSAAFEPKE
jgi:hypothetical protein